MFDWFLNTPLHIYTYSSVPYKLYTYWIFLLWNTLFLTKEEWNKVAVSELKEKFPKSIFHISLFVFHCRFIPSDCLRLKPNAKCLAYFLPPGAIKVFKRNTETGVTRSLGRWFLLKSRQISWWIYCGVYFKESCTYQLINNFTKNEHYPRSVSRVYLYFRVQIKILKIFKTSLVDCFWV